MLKYAFLILLNITSFAKADERDKCILCQENFGEKSRPKDNPHQECFLHYIETKIHEGYYEIPICLRPDLDSTTEPEFYDQDKIIYLLQRSQRSDLLVLLLRNKVRLKSHKTSRFKRKFKSLKALIGERL